jgi:WbqC-like protein family
LVAVMQPYFFPYLGTYQLAQAVDCFVFFDDVAFIKKGYIHRNALLGPDGPQPFTLPVREVSQNRTIAEHVYAGEWRPFLATLRQRYRQAPMFEAIYPLVESVALDPDENVARKNALSFTRVFEYLGLARDWSFASRHALPAELRAQARILALCGREGAGTYVNAAGGRALYQPEAFAAAGIALRFISNEAPPYDQGRDGFTPQLSMIDVLMHCPPEAVRERLLRFRLEP